MCRRRTAGAAARADDYKPTENGEPPLAKAQRLVAAAGPIDPRNQHHAAVGGQLLVLSPVSGPAQYPGFLPAQPRRLLDGTLAGACCGAGVCAEAVDLYVGGAEHAVLHLLYSRFWHKVLHDLGHVSTPEPFSRLVNQGIILGEDGQKMSKSRGNVVNPDDVVAEYGADAFRLYEMFMGPLEMAKPWSTRGVEGVYRFLGRVWRLFVDEQSEVDLEQRRHSPGPRQPHAPE